MSRHSLLVIIFILSVALATTHLIALRLSLYWALDWLDMAVHFAGGVLVSLGTLWVVFLSRYVPPRRESVRSAVLWALAAGLAFGISWEVFEVMAGIPIEHGNYALDTALDLAMDVVGSLTASVAYARARLLS